MSVSASQHADSTAESEDEPDEDPKVMLLVEAGRVPGLDDNLQHLRHRFKKKKKKKKNKRRKLLGEENRKSKKAKLELESDLNRYIIDGIISHINKPTKHEVFTNCLMLSEWLVKIPDDFEDNWILVPCPAGKRMLVVAAAGSTRCFAKSGDYIYYFQSALPGGHVVRNDETSKSLTILDCIWYHRKQTYYVLDVLSWNNSHMLHCEAKFRFFWIQQKLSELNAELQGSEKNHYRFSFLPRAQCQISELADVASTFCTSEEFERNVDGFLFYEQNSPYFSGTSSTVLWLKPFMVPEIFELPTCSGLLLDLPGDYESQEQYISQFEKNKKEVMKQERKLREHRMFPEGRVTNEKKVALEIETESEDVVVKVVVEEDTGVKEENVIKDVEMGCEETV